VREEERGEGGEEGGEREGTPLSLSLSPLPPSLLPPPRLQEVQPTFLDLPDGGLELGPSDGGDGCVDRQELAGACGLGPVGVDGGDVEGEESGAAGAGTLPCFALLCPALPSFAWLKTANNAADLVDQWSNSSSISCLPLFSPQS